MFAYPAFLPPNNYRNSCPSATTACPRIVILKKIVSDSKEEGRKERKKTEREGGREEEMGKKREGREKREEDTSK